MKFRSFAGIFAAALMVSAAPSYAQVQGLGILALDPVDDGHTVLNVNGRGVVNRAPDVAVFTAGVTTVSKTASEALSENVATMTSVMAALKAVGFAEADLQTSSLSISPVMSNEYPDFVTYGAAAANAAAELAALDVVEAAVEAAADAAKPNDPDTYVEQPPRIVGYRVSNQLSARQRKLGTYGATFDALVDAGANTINGPSLQLLDLSTSVDEAQALALADANRKAALMAGALNMRIVRMVMVEEGRVTGVTSRDTSNSFGFAEASFDGGLATPVSNGELTIQATVTILFEIAPQ